MIQALRRGDMMAGVYSELRGFVLAHRDGAGDRHAEVDPTAPDGYRLRLTSGCGVGGQNSSGECRP
jgi:hypothetical protein